MKNNLVIIFFTIILIGCGKDKKINHQKNDRFINYHLKKFDSTFVKYFPFKLSSEYNTIVSVENSVRGFVGILLYEYEMDDVELLDIENEVKSRALKCYKSDDNCLLVINRFDTDDTYDYPMSINLPNSIIVNKECYEGLLPIPKFFKYENVDNLKENNNNEQFETLLPPGFNIYVLEAKPEKHLEKYDLVPNRQMPDGWKNGYSKGVAISKKDQCVIYWSIAF